MDVENFGVGVTNKTVKKYNRHGKLIQDKDELTYAQYTETVYYDGRKDKTWSVLTFKGVVFDPLGPDGHRASRVNLKLSTSNKDTLEAYVKYLNTKNKIHMTRANRSFINV